MLLSIIIPTYQHGRELPQCLESILGQTFKNYEVIVVNDGSLDNTAEVLEKYQKKFNAFSKNFAIINQTNQGANVARNRGAKEAGGEFLLFCDADVILKKDALEKMLTALKEQKQASYVYSSFKFGFKLFRLWPFNEKRLKQMPYIHTTSLMRSKHFLGFDEKIKKFQDWDLWLTMLEKGYIGFWISEVLFKVMPRKKGMSYWLPSFFYKIPWQNLGIRIKAIEDYEKAKEIIKEKHRLG